MEPSKKAIEIKEYFRVQCRLITDNGQTKAAKAYVMKLIDDIPLLDGDFTKQYQYEWCQYTSYWYAVLTFLQ